MSFRWHPDEPPPSIEGHSRAKLRVLRSYLRAYFDRLAAHLPRDEFKLDLVDGFAGGGTFRDGQEIVLGTPLIMLEESESARQKLNRDRTKPLRFDFKHYFVDVEEAHTDHLKAALKERGYSADDERIVIRNDAFQAVADTIIAEIRRRQPRAGRSLFLLDQCGFTHVELALVARILRELPKAEVILTLAAETLVNFLAETPAIVQAVSPLDLTESDVHDLVQAKEGAGGRALVQRVLREKIRLATGAAYDTPFFIRPERSRRALWFLHLSRHPIARDVMIQCHWNNFSTFEHYGSGDFNMLGWDSLRSTESLRLFHFNELEADDLRARLLKTVPEELSALTSEGPITIDAVRHAFANRTAARFSDLDSVILQLWRERGIEIRGASDRVRSHKLRRLRPHDRIAMPQQLRLFLKGAGKNHR